MSASAFWKPGTIAPGTSIERESDEDHLSTLTFPRSTHLSIEQQRLLLPIYAHKYQILYALERYHTLIVVGETGSGKSTQIPQYLDAAGWTTGTISGRHRCIAITQPRTVAATSLASRVATEMNVVIGEQVGYCVRFDDCSSPSTTRIKYLTDGMLLREIMSDPLLSHYSVVMLDEAHERSVATDILCGLLKKIQRKRRDLRLIISSATMDADLFASFFETNHSGDRTKDTCIIMNVEGRQYPVDIMYTQYPVRSYIQAAIDTVKYIHHTQPAGDILVFMTGRAEVEYVVRMLHEDDTKLMPLPLFAGLSPQEQAACFELTPSGRRKVVVATNVAETSVTIDDIVYVIDTGFAKQRTYDPRTGLSSLLVAPISQSSARQRTGRAGRVRAGICYRLYTEQAFLQLPLRTIPEIQRSNMASICLQLKALGIDDIIHFPYLSSPPIEIMVRAIELLYATSAIDEYGKLTKPVGEQMAEFPVEPMTAKMLLASGTHGCSEEILTIASMLSIDSVFIIPSGSRTQADRCRYKFAVHEGDHLTMLNVYNAFIYQKQSSKWCAKNYLNYRALKRAVQIRSQLRRFMTRFGIPIVSSDKPDLIRRCIVSGYFSHAAQLSHSGSYRPITGADQLYIHPNSVLSNDVPQWVIYHQVVETGKKYMRDVTVIEPMWLAEEAPHYYEYKSQHQRASESIDAKLRASGVSRTRDDDENDDEKSERPQKTRKLF